MSSSRGSAKVLPARTPSRTESSKSAELGAKMDEVRSSLSAQKKRRVKRVRKTKSFFSKLFSRKNTVVRYNKRSREMINALAITEDEVRKMKKFFDSIDIDNAGDVDFDEVFDKLKQPRTMLTDAIFTVIEDPESKVIPLTFKEREELQRESGANVYFVKGSLSFNDFLQTICTFCLYSKEDILLFAFNTFDVDNSGTIDEAEFIQLCAVVNNNEPHYPDNFKLALQMFKNADGMMNFEEFKTLDSRFPMILHPAFRFQDTIQSKILGRRTWARINARLNRSRQLELARLSAAAAENSLPGSADLAAFDGEVSPTVPEVGGSSCCGFRNNHVELIHRGRKPPTARETVLRRAAQYHVEKGNTITNNGPPSARSSTSRRTSSKSEISPRLASGSTVTRKDPRGVRSSYSSTGSKSLAGMPRPESSGSLGNSTPNSRNRSKF